MKSFRSFAMLIYCNLMFHRHDMVSHFYKTINDEFEKSKSTTKELKAFQDKLASLHFLERNVPSLIQFDDSRETAA